MIGLRWAIGRTSPDFNGKRPTAPTQSLELRSSRAMRLLVVEDEPELLAVISRALREQGYAVDEAADGQEGLVRAAIVHTPVSSDGGFWLAKWASTAAVTKAKRLRSCWRQVSITLSMVSTNRLPAALCVPNDSFRQITA